MSSPVSTGIGNHLLQVYHPSIYLGHLGTLSLAIPLWVGAMSTIDGFAQRLGRNSEFWIVVFPVTRHTGLLFDGLIWPNTH